MWEAKLYTGDKFIGKIVEKSLTALKRCASQKCNGYYNTLDTMVVCKAKGHGIPEIKLIRVNQIYPNNTIIRGQWK